MRWGCEPRFVWPRHPQVNGVRRRNIWRFGRLIDVHGFFTTRRVRELSAALGPAGPEVGRSSSSFLFEWNQDRNNIHKLYIINQSHLSVNQRDPYSNKTNKLSSLFTQRVPHNNPSPGDPDVMSHDVCVSLSMLVFKRVLMALKEIQHRQEWTQCPFLVHSFVMVKWGMRQIEQIQRGQ